MEADDEDEDNERVVQSGIESMRLALADEDERSSAEKRRKATGRVRLDTRMLIGEGSVTKTNLRHVSYGRDVAALVETVLMQYGQKVMCNSEGTDDERKQA